MENFDDDSIMQGWTFHPDDSDNNGSTEGFAVDSMAAVRRGLGIRPLDSSESPNTVGVAKSKGFVFNEGVSLHEESLLLMNEQEEEGTGGREGLALDLVQDEGRTDGKPLTQSASLQAGVLECASAHVTRFTSCDESLCVPAVASFNVSPSMDTFRGAASLVPKGKIVHPVEDPQCSAYPLFLVPPLFPKHDNRVPVARFFSIYADLPPMPAAGSAGDTGGESRDIGTCSAAGPPSNFAVATISKRRSISTDSPTTAGASAVYVRVERTVFHPVTQGCMKQTGLTVVRGTGNWNFKKPKKNRYPPWTLYWGARFKDEGEFFTLAPYQRVNHFPRTWLLGRKDHLARGLQKAARRMAKTPFSQAFDFVPTSYSLPIDMGQLQRDVRNQPGQIFICKPSASAQGKGIYLFQRTVPEDIIALSNSIQSAKAEAATRAAKPLAVEAKKPRPPQQQQQQQRRIRRDSSDDDDDDDTSSSSASSDDDDDNEEEDEDCIVQQYIANPLLINGFKSDLRIYVLCTCFDPLTVYVFNDGLVRFATERYDPSNTDNVFSHLTNYSLNKKNTTRYEKSQDDGNGSKWTLHALKRFLTSQGQDFDALWNRVHDVIVKTMISVESSIAGEVAQKVKYMKSCYELYGFDIMLTDDLEPKLIEVNVLPSLACASALDKHIKGNMIADTLTLIGVPGQRSADSSNSSSPTTTGGVVVTSSPTGGASGNNIRLKSFKNNAEVIALLKKNSYAFFGSPLITEDEKSILREFEEEFHRAGGFTRVCPATDTAERYAPLFEKDRRFNWVMWRWEEEKRRFTESERAQAYAWLQGEASYPMPAHCIDKENVKKAAKKPTVPVGPSLLHRRTSSSTRVASARYTAQPKQVTPKVPIGPSQPKASLRVSTFEFVEVPGKS